MAGTRARCEQAVTKSTAWVQRVRPCGVLDVHIPPPLTGHTQTRFMDTDDHSGAPLTARVGRDCANCGAPPRHRSALLRELRHPARAAARGGGLDPARDARAAGPGDREAPAAARAAPAVRAPAPDAPGGLAGGDGDAGVRRGGRVADAAREAWSRWRATSSWMSAPPPAPAAPARGRHRWRWRRRWWRWRRGRRPAGDHRDHHRARPVRWLGGSDAGGHARRHGHGQRRRRSGSGSAAVTLPPIKHVFLVMLSGQGFNQSFGDDQGPPLPVEHRAQAGRAHHPVLRRGVVLAGQRDRAASAARARRRTPPPTARCSRPSRPPATPRAHR